MAEHRVIVCGSVAQRPHHGGHTWVFLQYLLGFRRLGWDVLFLDRLDPAACVDGAGQPCEPRDSTAFAFLRRTLEAFGLGSSFAVLCDGRAATLGRDRAGVLEFARTSELLLNVMGFCQDEEIMAAARRRVFLDIDPGFPQMWRELALHDAFAGHDAFVTVGAGVGGADCLAPDCGLSWTRIPPPVALDHWPRRPADGAPDFSTIATWRGPFGPIEYDGRTFGLRVHEFRALLPLPGRTGRRFELALDIDPADHQDMASIRGHGWTVRDPRAVAGDPWEYRDYVQRSGAEFSVAKNLYVQARTGWFSDRSACYLASGRPVLTQDTGFGAAYPTGEGLLTFQDLDGAVEGVEAIVAEPDRHRRAAREFAESYLDTDRVLPRLVDAVAG